MRAHLAGSLNAVSGMLADVRAPSIPSVCPGVVIGRVLSIAAVTGLDPLPAEWIGSRATSPGC